MVNDKQCIVLHLLYLRDYCSSNNNEIMHVRHRVICNWCVAAKDRQAGGAAEPSFFPDTHTQTLQRQRLSLLEELVKVNPRC